MLTPLTVLSHIDLWAAQGPNPAALQGGPLPEFKALDLHGKERGSKNVAGQRTVLIVMPNEDASKATQKWAKQTMEHFAGKSVQVIIMMALNTPFFVPDTIPTNIAKGKVPKRFWDNTWISTADDLRKALRVENTGKEPEVFAVNEQGTIVATAHGTPTKKNTGKIWGALGEAG